MIHVKVFKTKEQALKICEDAMIVSALPDHDMDHDEVVTLQEAPDWNVLRFDERDLKATCHAVTEELARRAVSGDALAAGELFASPTRLKAWLDTMAGRVEAEGSLMSYHGSTKRFWGYASGARAPERFAERGLPQNADELVRQYKTLGSKASRVDFKNDVQGIERAILSGAVEALGEMAERSPMALWAMDFSLSEYEAENVLGFAAKYAPIGADINIIELLMGLGARLPKARLSLVVGESMLQAKGVWMKRPEAVARALEAAGYEFGYADGLALLGKASFEHVAVSGLPSVARQKIAWLDEIERRTGVNWGIRHSANELEVLCGHLGEALGQTERVAQLLDHAKTFGPVGLGAWLGLGSSPLRDTPVWAELGPWLARHALATEALAAAKASGAVLTAERVRPYAEIQEISEAASGGSAALGSKSPLRI